ncbi:MAG TPA: FAD-dependent monooxygenase [Propionibacteriaceae bacterium]|nr:FAD-dependent monooxygenase [Propionibacteriaceae bacterium]
MTISIVGAGPTGLYLGIALARHGHRVRLIERDAGPSPDGTWARRGVMQFHHAHGFRPQVTDALRAEMPEVYDRWLDLGAEPVDLPGPTGTIRMGTRSRRMLFEQALREIAAAQPGLELIIGHVDSVLVGQDRAAGLVVDGTPVPSDVVIDASGRSGRVTRSLGARKAIGGSCGIAYVDRMYQLHDPADAGPLTNPLAWQADFDGYQVLVFLHELGIFSAVIIRPSVDRELQQLRDDAAFDAACRAIPGLSHWTDPSRSRPVTPVLPGANLLNHYQAQTTGDGRLVLPGLYFVGDAVCTTTPTFGRGMATSLLQARELLRLIDTDSDPTSIGHDFDAWCERELRPWVEDHMRIDDAQRRRWLGADIDLTAKLPSDLIMKAAQVDPTIQPAAWDYLAMTDGALVLDPFEERARAVYRTGWRPPWSDGPSRDELVAIISADQTLAA